MAIDFEVVSPTGVLMHEEGLERVVLRRREERYELGSEVAVYPHHGPMLMRTQACTARLLKHGLERRFDVPAGVAEVLDDHVTLIVT